MPTTATQISQGCDLVRRPLGGKKEEGNEDWLSCASRAGTVPELTARMQSPEASPRWAAVRGSGSVFNLYIRWRFLSDGTIHIRRRRIKVGAGVAGRGGRQDTCNTAELHGVHDR